MVTTWDGRVRIDHVAEAATVALTLLTVERTREMALRTGLVAAFVEADPTGPPSWIAVGLVDGRLPADIAEMLGPRLAAAVADLLAAGGAGAWAQLDLAEVGALASAWAPYRARVALAGTRPVTEPYGSTATGSLWSWVALPDLSAPRPVLRGGSEAPTDAARGTLRLPAELARAAGVEVAVTWAMSVAGPGLRIELEATAVPDGRSRPRTLTVRIDGADRAVAFAPGPAGRLRAVVTAGTGEVPLRFEAGT